MYRLIHLRTVLAHTWTVAAMVETGRFWPAKRMMRARSTARREAARRRLRLSSSALSWEERTKGVCSRGRIKEVGWR